MQRATWLQFQSIESLVDMYLVHYPKGPTFKVIMSELTIRPTKDTAVGHQIIRQTMRYHASIENYEEAARLEL
jgi:hypothetical protein